MTRNMTMVKHMRHIQQHISAGQFKANCLGLMDEVNLQTKPRKSLFGTMREADL